MTNSGVKSARRGRVRTRNKAAPCGIYCSEVVLLQGAIREKRAFRENGVCVLTVDISLPLPDGAAGELYKKLVRQYMCAAEGQLAPEACREFRESSDDKKRFRFRPYAFEVSYEYREAEGVMTVIRQERLSRRGRTVSQRQEKDFFDAKSGLLIKQGRREDRKKKEKRAKRENKKEGS